MSDMSDVFPLDLLLMSLSYSVDELCRRLCPLNRREKERGDLIRLYLDATVETIENAYGKEWNDEAESHARPPGIKSQRVRQRSALGFADKEHREGGEQSKKDGIENQIDAEEIAAVSFPLELPDEDNALDKRRTRLKKKVIDLNT
jgi:hypothetical protein